MLSDELNHASIIDGIRLARPGGKAVYEHADVGSLERKLGEVPDGARCLIVTDGVFSMEGDLAPLPDLVELAERHDATLIVDDSHGIGVLGETGAGTAEHFGLAGRIDVITGTLGKALGGAAGGFVAGSERALRAARAALPRAALLERPAAVGRLRGARGAGGAAGGAGEAGAGCTRTSPASGRASPPPASSRSTARARSSRSSSARRAPRSPSARSSSTRASSRSASASRSCPRERPGSARSSQPRSATSRSTPRWRRSRSTLSGSPSALPGAPRT